MQDIKTRAETGRKTIPEEYDMTMEEFFEIVHMAKSMNADGLCEPITTAYLARFEAGVRYAREGATV